MGNFPQERDKVRNGKIWEDYKKVKIPIKEHGIWGEPYIPRIKLENDFIKQALCKGNIDERRGIAGVLKAGIRILFKDTPEARELFGYTKRDETLYIDGEEFKITWTDAGLLFIEKAVDKTTVY